MPNDDDQWLNERPRPIFKYIAVLIAPNNLIQLPEKNTRNVFTNMVFISGLQFCRSILLIRWWIRKWSFSQNIERWKAVFPMQMYRKSSQQQCTGFRVQNGLLGMPYIREEMQQLNEIFYSIKHDFLWPGQIVFDRLSVVRKKLYQNAVFTKDLECLI